MSQEPKPIVIAASVVGMKFHKNATETLMGIAPETRMNLERDRANKYDPNAVKVMYEGAQLGFIPAALAKTVAPLIDGGRPFTVVRAPSVYGITIVFDGDPL